MICMVHGGIEIAAHLVEMNAIVRAFQIMLGYIYCDRDEAERIGLIFQRPPLHPLLCQMMLLQGPIIIRILPSIRFNQLMQLFRGTSCIHKRGTLIRLSSMVLADCKAACSRILSLSYRPFQRRNSQLLHCYPARMMI